MIYVIIYFSIAFLVSCFVAFLNRAGIFEDVFINNGDELLFIPVSGLFFPIFIIAFFFLVLPNVLSKVIVKRLKINKQLIKKYEE